jgi:hypothetical protein
MNKLKTMLDTNVLMLSEKERYFAPSFVAARGLLDNVIVGNGGLTFPSGVTCGPSGCTCGNRACLHTVAWRVYTGK